VSLQAADAILDVIGRMGGSVARGDSGLTVTGSGVINGISADHLSLFLELKEGFGAFALSRANQRDPFQNPNAPNPPPSVPGLRTRPLGSCNRLIGSCAPLGGACRGEDVCLWVN